MILKADAHFETVAPLVYFSSTTENTKHLVEQLPFDSVRIPISRLDPLPLATEPYVLFVPSYGGGDGIRKLSTAVPRQVVNFLNVKQNRDLCLGIIASGNINFGSHYCIAGELLSSKLQVPLFYTFELRGMPGDLERITEGLVEVFERRSRGLLFTSGETLAAVTGGNPGTLPTLG